MAQFFLSMESGGGVFIAGECAPIAELLNGVFAGISACSCYTAGGGSSSNATITEGINGDFELTYDVINLCWRANIGKFNLNFYGDEICGILNQQDEYWVSVFVECSCGSYRIRMFADFEAWPVPFTGAIQIFDASAYINVETNNEIICATPGVEVIAGGTGALSVMV